MTIAPLQRAGEEFAALLTRWRTQRGLSKRALAIAMGFDPSYVSHIEGRRHPPTEDFARRAEDALDAGGEIWASYAAIDALRQAEAPARAPAPVGPLTVPGIGLIVERERAAVGLAGGRYHVAVRQMLRNVGADPVTGLPVRIGPDPFPGRPQRSARAYFGAPMTVAELGFSARRLTAATSDPAQAAGEPLAWRVAGGSDAHRDLWLEFGVASLAPGRQTMIEYAYHLSAYRSGPWFGRTIRFPTRELHVRLDFPASARPSVRGVVCSLVGHSDLPADRREFPGGFPAEFAGGFPSEFAGGFPAAFPGRLPDAFRPAGSRAGRALFAWSVRAPALGATYLFEWRLRSGHI